MIGHFAAPAASITGRNARPRSEATSRSSAAASGSSSRYNSARCSSDNGRLPPSSNLRTVTIAGRPTAAICSPVGGFGNESTRTSTTSTPVFPAAANPPAVWIVPTIFGRENWIRLCF